MEHVSPNPDPIDRPQWRKTSKDQQFPSSLAWCWCLENEMVKLEEQTYKVIIHFRLALTSFKYRSKSGGPVAWAPIHLVRSLWVWALLSLSLCQCVSESVTMRTIDCAPESNCVSVCFSRFLLNNDEDGHLGHKEARTPSFWDGQLVGLVHGHFINAATTSGQPACCQISPLL